MRTDIGRFYEGRALETITILRSIYEIGTGAENDVVVWIEGREMVFGKAEENVGRGFMRITATDTLVTVAFPRGQKIIDPAKRAKGPVGSTTRMTVAHAAELDTYFRRMVESAYLLE